MQDRIIGRLRSESVQRADVGILLALLSAFAYGASDYLGGIASRRARVLAVVVLSQLVGLAILLVVLRFLPPAAVTPGDLMFGALAGVTGSCGIAFLYRGLSRGRMSVVSPITAVVAAIAPLVYGLAHGERPSPIALAGVAIALVAIALVTAAPSQQDANVPARDAGSPWWREPGVIDALISGLAIGGFYILIAHTNPASGLWPLVPSRLVSALICAVAALVFQHSLRPVPGSFRLILAAGAIDMAANAMYLEATRFGYLSIVAVLASLYPASTVVLARALLRERFTRAQSIGLACAAAGVACIAAGR
jgi:drug/metabolite transporter (DMT)-like permease